MRTVEASVSIRVSPGTAILSFTDPVLLKEWWGVERSLLQLKPGGVYTLAWGISDKGVQYISSGIVRSYDPAGLLHIEKYIYLNPERSFLGPMELEISATPTNNGCHLLLRQGPYPENASADWDWLYDAVKKAWPTVLQSLKKYLEEKFTV